MVPSATAKGSLDRLSAFQVARFMHMRSRFTEWPRKTFRGGQSSGFGRPESASTYCVRPVERTHACRLKPSPTSVSAPRSKPTAASPSTVQLQGRALGQFVVQETSERLPRRFSSQLEDTGSLSGPLDLGVRIMYSALPNQPIPEKFMIPFLQTFSRLPNFIVFLLSIVVLSVSACGDSKRDDGEASDVEADAGPTGPCSSWSDWKCDAPFGSSGGCMASCEYSRIGCYPGSSLCNYGKVGISSMECTRVENAHGGDCTICQAVFEAGCWSE